MVVELKGVSRMTREEKYKEFINIVCEMLRFNKPIDVLKLCQITSEFIIPYEKLITELEKENEKLKEQIEKMKCCENCKHQNRVAGESKWWEHCAHCKADSEWELANDKRST